MDVLHRITELRLQRGWSEYQLAEHAELTQSTISTWYRKKVLPTIPSLQKICVAFGISMSQFFMEDDEEAVYVDQLQKELLSLIAGLSEKQRVLLIDFLKLL